MSGLMLVQSASLFVLSLDVLWNGADGANNAEVEQHLEMGKKLLAAGQLADALSHYHAAVEGDPGNYLTYYKRATVYLALGKSRSALPDLNKVVKLKPDFISARLQRGNVLLKQGNLDEAKEDFSEAVNRDPSNTEAREKLQLIEPLKSEIKQAMTFYQNRNYQAAIETLTKIIEICLWDPELKEIRAECYIAQGDLVKAIGDIRPTAKLRPDNTAAYLKLSLLHYEIGESEESLGQIRECLKLDPDHKDCHNHYKKVKKLVKQLQSVQEMSNEHRFDDCVNRAKQILETEPKVFPYVLRAHSHSCHCLSQGGRAKEALQACQKVLDMEPENIYALMDSAEAHLAIEEFDEALNDYQAAHNIDQNNRQAREGINKVQKLIKQSKKRDYYKILGVRRNAKKKEILKAYRKLAVIWHPDKYEGEDKKKAEKMFIDIASAKEVLTDPEKRQRYDNGEDPLDPEEQHGGGDPFFHGFNPFGAGGFSFKFNFN